MYDGAVAVVVDMVLLVTKNPPSRLEREREFQEFVSLPTPSPFPPLRLTACIGARCPPPHPRCLSLILRQLGRWTWYLDTIDLSDRGTSRASVSPRALTASHREHCHL
jgi:hypothetical protein